MRTNKTNFTLNYIITGILTSAVRCFHISYAVLQSAKFDHNGDYLRKWIPELHNIDAKDIHASWENGIKVKGYPEQPIIERDKERTLREYKLSKEEIRS